MRDERRASAVLHSHPNRFHQSNDVHRRVQLFLRCPRRLQRLQMTSTTTRDCDCDCCQCRYCEAKSASSKIAAAAAATPEDSFAFASLPAVAVVADGGDE